MEISVTTKIAFEESHQKKIGKRIVRSYSITKTE